MIKINYEYKGQGFPIVFIHGLSDDLRLWDPLLTELSKKYRTITFDLRGHGKSEKPEGPYSMKQFAGDLYGLLQKLDIKEAHFVGFSIGGAILQQFTLLSPDMVKSMVLMSSFSYVNPHLKNELLKLQISLIEGGFASFFDYILPLILDSKHIKENQIEIAEVKKEKIKTVSDDALIRSIDACLEFDIKDSKIDKPALIISGRDDIFTPVQLEEELHKDLKHSKWEIIEDTGHNVLIEENVPLILEMIDDFFETI
ncbi:MAG: alpha/beta fold hydrolase [Methanobacterium sp.]